MLTSPCFEAASKHFSVHNSISRNILLYCSGRSLRLSPGARSTNDEGRMVSSQSNIIILLPSAAFDEVGGDMIIVEMEMVYVDFAMLINIMNYAMLFRVVVVV